jgi:hypothetical protein
MRHHFLPRTVFITIALLAFHGMSLAQAGSSGLAFLKLGVSARGTAMADAMSATVSGPSAMYYNPAGILEGGAATPATNVMFSHKQWIQDTQLQFLGASLTFDEKNAAGIALTTTSISDIEIREVPGDPAGTFTARNFLLGATYARMITQDVKAAVSLKYLYEKIYIDEASGYGIDLGAQWQTPMHGLAVGGTIANLGSMTTLRTQKSSLPSLLRLGPAYTLEFFEPLARLTIAADGLYLFPEKRTYINLGGEFVYGEMVAGRLGYQFGSTGRGFTAGIGLRYTFIELDYAYAPLAYDLGNTHTLSLALHF